MVEVRELRTRRNMVLRRGAAQHWSFGDSAMPRSAVWERLVMAYARGRCLIVGPVADSLLERISAAGIEVSVLTWAIPDAYRIAERLPQSTVFCGDVSDLPHDLGDFDTVVCTDLAAVVSLEATAESWRSVFDTVRARVAQDGRLLLCVENDLAPHRLAASHNPRSANADSDWAPLSTWDSTRPRSVEQVRSLGPDGVWALAPGWPDVRVAWRAGAGGDAAEALALGAAMWPLRGPDPAWLFRSLTMAGRLDDAGAGWLCVFGPDVDLPDLLVEDGTPPTDASGRPLLGLIADACAAHDVPAIRDLLAGWRAAVGAHPRAGADLAAWLVDGARHRPLLEGEGQDHDPWSALVGLTLALRGRSWRHPWPATTSDADLLAILGAMAGLGEPPQDALATLGAGLPTSKDHFAHLDRQQLVAAIDRNNEMIRTLRSRVAWTERQYLSFKMAETAKGYRTRARGVARRVVRRARRP